ncbi:MAG: hypothetical protein SO130_00050 [Agathobacter sp.]|nr:hypothetical protein [Agathobacter sp.]
MGENVTEQAIKGQNTNQALQELRQTPNWEAVVSQFEDLQQQFKTAGKKLEDYFLVGDMTLGQAMEKMGQDTRDEKKVQECGALLVAFCNYNRLPVNIANPDPDHIDFSVLMPEENVKDVNGCPVFQAGMFEKASLEQLTQLNWWDKLCNLFGITTERMRQHKQELAAQFQNVMIENATLEPYKKNFEDNAEPGRKITAEATKNKKNLEKLFFTDGKVPEKYVFTKVRQGKTLSALALGTLFAMNKMNPEQRKAFEMMSPEELAERKDITDILSSAGEKCRKLIQDKKKVTQQERFEKLDDFLFNKKTNAAQKSQEMDEMVINSILGKNDYEFRPCRKMEEKFKGDLDAARNMLPEVAVLLDVKAELQKAVMQNGENHKNGKLRTFYGEETFKGLMNQVTLSKQLAQKAQSGDLKAVQELTKKNIENQLYTECVCNEDIHHQKTLKGKGRDYEGAYMTLHSDINGITGEYRGLNQMGDKTCASPDKMLVVNRKISQNRLKDWVSFSMTLDSFGVRDSTELNSDGLGKFEQELNWKPKKIQPKHQGMSLEEALKLVEEDEKKLNKKLNKIQPKHQGMSLEEALKLVEEDEMDPMHEEVNVERELL